MKSLRIVLNSRTWEKKRVHQLALFIMVNFTKNRTPFISKSLYSFYTFRANHFYYFFCKLRFRFLKLFPNPHKFTDDYSLIFVLFSKQMFELLLEGGLFWLGSAFKYLSTNKLDRLVEQLRFKVVNFDCRSCFFKQTVLKMRVFSYFHSV